MEKDKLRINIKIDGRAYPLNIDWKDEERYRKAAKMVNETLAGFRNRFRNADQQELMAMTAFQMALKYALEQERSDYSQFIDEIKNINDDITDFLKERK